MQRRRLTRPAILSKPNGRNRRHRKIIGLAAFDAAIANIALNSGGLATTPMYLDHRALSRSEKPVREQQRS